jgi:hypothetical protein
MKPLARNTRSVNAILTIPTGALFLICGMHLAFDCELIGRYDELWADWCTKVIADHLGLGGELGLRLRLIANHRFLVWDPGDVMTDHWLYHWGCQLLRKLPVGQGTFSKLLPDMLEIAFNWGRVLPTVVSGHVFASPPVGSILAAIRVVTGPLGCLPITRGSNAVLLINGLGATRIMELMIAAREVVPALQLEYGVAVDRVYTGSPMTSLDMAGFSITIMKLDENILLRLYAPTSTMFDITKYSGRHDGNFLKIKTLIKALELARGNCTSTISLIMPPREHGRGGQSALRFARLRMEKRHNYVRKTAELATQFFINPATSQPNVAGLILAGSADFKTELSQSDMFDQRLQAKITIVVDVSYDGENGFNQAVELSTEILANVKFVQEKKLIGKYFEEISQDTGKYVFGVDDTLMALEMGAVETLIIWENLDINIIMNPIFPLNFSFCLTAQVRPIPWPSFIMNVNYSTSWNVSWGWKPPWLLQPWQSIRRYWLLYFGVSVMMISMSIGGT